MDKEPLSVAGQHVLTGGQQDACAIRAVLFDLGHVLVDFEHWRAAESISYFTDKSPQEIFDLFRNEAAVRNVHMGVLHRSFSAVKVGKYSDSIFEDFVGVHIFFR